MNNINKELIAASFSKAATSYDKAAAFQRIAADRLMERLNEFDLEPENILDVGSGTGYCTRMLKKKYPNAELIGLDIAPGMVEYSQNLSSFEKYICADILNSPLESNSQDLIFSNLTFQWLNRLDALFKELHRILKPNGVILFTSLGPRTLFELKESWKKIDQHKHVNDFLDMHYLSDALSNASLCAPSVESELVVINYERAIDLMRDLKNIGAQNLDKVRNKGLTSPIKIKLLEKEYRQFKLDNDELPATYELIYGHAFANKKL